MRLAALLLLVMAAGLAATPIAAAERRVAADGLSMRIPAAWHATGAPLTNVIEPVYRLAIANRPIRRQPGDDGPCLGGLARSLGPRGVLLFVIEYREGIVPSRFEPRPRELPLPRATDNAWCMPPRAASFTFGERGRALHVGVRMGPKATDSDVRALERAWRSLRVRPAPRLAHAPWLAPVRFARTPGWRRSSTGSVLRFRPSGPPDAAWWISSARIGNVPFRDAELADPPWRTLAPRARHMVVVTAQIEPTRRAWRAAPRPRLDLRDAEAHLCCDNLPPPSIHTRELVRIGERGAYRILVHAYFGRPGGPNAADLRTAQRLVDRLRLPPPRSALGAR
jgi:hypothetical protein